jgi:hypothetical protein
MIALKLESGDVVWMDAVLSFSESYSSSVTKHQIESGSSISDHIIQDNAKFSISGVVTEVDFCKTFDLQKISQDVIPNQENIKNLEFQPTQVLIGSSQQNPLVKLLPSSISQFIGNDSPPEVVMGAVAFEKNSTSVYETLKSIINGFTEVTADRKTIKRKQVVSLMEFDTDFTVKNLFDNCVCTSLSFAQDPESGDAIYPQMSFEQVRFVELMKTTFPTNRISSDVKNSGSEKAQKGNQPAKEYDIPQGIAAPAKTETSSLKNDSSILKDLTKQATGG